jgi:hypothetical protein
MKAISFFLLGLITLCYSAAANTFVTSGNGQAPTGQAFFSPTGTDAALNRIGIDCKYVAPCKTTTKLLAFVAANVAAYPNMTVKYDGGNGPNLVPSTAIWTPDQTGTGNVTIDVYNGNSFVLSAGIDTAGSWSSTTLPSGAAGCVSNYLVSQAPLVDGTTTTKATSYVGVAWFYGHRVAETIRPQIGSTWAAAPGTLGTSTIGASVFAGTTAIVTSGVAALSITDLSQVGIVGQPVAFETGLGTGGGQTQILANHVYWIASKSAATGTGTITIDNAPPTLSGALMTANASGTLNVQDPVQSNNFGDRSSHSKQNQFTYDPAQADIGSAYNQNDVGVELGYNPSMARVAAINTTSHLVTINSRMVAIGSSIYPGTMYRVWNRFEDLGASSITGEIYNDRTTGYLYYAPMAGETCAGLNVAGTAIIPGTSETILKISNAIADYSGTIGKPVGNLTINNAIFSHTNNSIMTGEHVLNGSVGGFISSISEHYAPAMAWAVEGIGASNVTINGGGVQHVGGSGYAFAWGSNHVTIENTTTFDGGGAGVVHGGDLFAFDQADNQTDSGYYGTNKFGPTTPSFSTSGSPYNVDGTGASDCCFTLTNNFIHDWGRIHPGSSCISSVVDQNDVVTHNTIYNCPSFGVAMSSDPTVSAAAPSYNGIVQGIVVGGSTRAPHFNNQFSYNEIYYCGYETSLTGVAIPGSSLFSDFGCHYASGPQDGDGTKTGYVMTYNKVHDVSAGAYQNVVANGGNSTVKPTGSDGVLDYHDANDSNGYDEENNWFYNRAYTAVGDGTHPTAPVRLTQHTGNIRSLFKNNIWAGVFPAGYSTANADGDHYYQPMANVQPYSNTWRANSAYGANSSVFSVDTASFYFSTSGGTTGNSGGPTCTGTPGVTTCSVDGGVTWIYEGTGQSVIGTGGTAKIYGTWQNNIVAWSVTGTGTGTTATSDTVALAGVTQNTPFYQFTNNLYSYAGNALVNMTTNKTMTAWQAITGPSSALEDYQTLWGAAGVPDAPGVVPNFVSLTTGNLAFGLTQVGPGTASACSGAAVGTVSPACSTNVGYVAPDLSNVGAHANLGVTQTPGPSAALYAAPYYSCVNNYYVSTAGNDTTGTGSIGAPWATLQKANNVGRAAGDCVNVSPGVYSGVVVNSGGNLASSTGYVVYRCTALDACTVNATAGTNNSAGFFLSPATANYVMFDGFAISGSNTAYGQGIEVFNSNTAFSNHHIWLLNSIVYGNGQSGAQMNDGEFFYLIHNKFYNNSNAGCGAQGSGVSLTTMKATTGYSPTSDDLHNPNPLIGQGSFVSGADILRNVVMWNISYNNALLTCGSAPSPYDTDGNGIIFDSNTGNGNTLGGIAYVYPNFSLAAFNVLYNSGGGGVHVFFSSNTTVANNTSYNNYIDPFNQGSARAMIDSQNGYNNTFINNVAYSIPATSSGCGYNYPNVPYEQWNTSYIGSPPTTGITTPDTWSHNISYRPGGTCGGEAPMYNGDVFSTAINLVATNPLFVSVGGTTVGTETSPPVGSNFALQSSSPAIGYGLLEPYLPIQSQDAGACAHTLAACP